MTPAEIDRVFGRGRLKMVTGEHVEVFREAVAPGERRRYTKRFLKTREGDYGQWTEREWRILARLIGHGITCVPDVVQYDRGRQGGIQLVQTYDAGVTVDQWATLLPVTRDDRVQRHVFEDCAHWWALAHHCLRALNEVHALELVHLDVKGDNVCIPYAPASFDPHSSDLGLRPVFTQLALIDFAFSLVSRESLTTPLPIGWQRDYDYQSPRLLAALEAGRAGELKPTRELDWRCDMYSLAAMLKRYLPASSTAEACGWTPTRHDAARALILRVRDAHDRELTDARPHAELIEQTGAWLIDRALAESLERGWALAREASVAPAPASPLTPVTRLAAPVHVTRSGRATAVTVVAPTRTTAPAPPAASTATASARAPKRPVAHALALVALGAVVAFLATLPLVGEFPFSGFFEREVGGAETDPASAPDAPILEPLPTGGTAGNPTDKAVAPSPPETGSPGTASGETPVPVQAPPATSPPPAASQAPASQAPATPQTPTTPQAPAPLRGATTPSPPISNPAQLSRGAARAARATPPAAQVAPRAEAAPPAAPKRQLPSWVSLQPPSWLRTGTPPLPPGMKTSEPAAAIVAAGSAAEAPHADPAPAAPSSASPPTAPTAAAAAATEPAAQSATPAAKSAAAATPGREAPRAAGGLSRFLARALPGSAPVEERSPSVTRNPSPAEDNPRVPERSSPTLALATPSAPVDARPVPPVPERPGPDDFAAQGRRTLADTVPRAAAQAEREVSRVLWLAAGAYHPTQDAAVAEAAREARIADDWLVTRVAVPSEARRLNDEARAAIGVRRNIREAFDLQLRAFGANPRDPEIAGNLAVLYLKLSPPQPDAARQVALFALAARAPHFHSTRLEDWNTFAVASALAGREADATRALYVTLALSASVEGRCVSALNSLASYGERMRAPVEALLYRVRTQGRALDAPACAWPATWTVRRLP